MSTFMLVQNRRQVQPSLLFPFVVKRAGPLTFDCLEDEAEEDEDEEEEDEEEEEEEDEEERIEVRELRDRADDFSFPCFESIDGEYVLGRD